MEYIKLFSAYYVAATVVHALQIVNNLTIIIYIIYIMFEIWIHRSRKNNSSQTELMQKYMMHTSQGNCKTPNLKRSPLKSLCKADERQAMCKGREI